MKDVPWGAGSLQKNLVEYLKKKCLFNFLHFVVQNSSCLILIQILFVSLAQKKPFYKKTQTSNILKSPIGKFSVNFFKDEMRGMDSGHCLTGWLSYSPPNTFRFIYITCGLNKRYPPPPTLLYKGVVVMYLWRRTERIRIRLYTLYKYHIDGSVVWKETLPAQGKQISWLGWTHTCENCPEVCTISPHLWELSWGVHN